MSYSKYMQSFIDAWNRFWFTPAPTQNLCLIRIFYGAVFFLKLSGGTGFYRLSSFNMKFPQHAFHNESLYFLDGFNLPVWGFDWLPIPSFLQYRILENVVLVLSIFFTVGLFTRWVAPLMFGIYAYLFCLSQFTYHHHTFLLLVVLAILAASPCADHYSLDSYFKRLKPANPLHPITSLRFLQVLVSIVYFFAVLSKLNPNWSSGRALDLLVLDKTIKGDFSPFILALMSTKFLSIFTLVSEAFLAFGLWIPALRRWAILLGIIFHLGIDAMLHVGTFSYQMIVLYIAFISPIPGRANAINTKTD